MRFIRGGGKHDKDSLVEMSIEKQTDESETLTSDPSSSSCSSLFSTTAAATPTTVVVEEEEEGRQYEQEQQPKPKRRVQLAEDYTNTERCNHVVMIHETQPFSDEEFQAYFTQPHDFKRFDLDVKRTIQQWVEYKKNKNSSNSNNNTESSSSSSRHSFHEDEYTMRGLEEVLDHLRCKTNKVSSSLSLSTKTGRQDLKNRHTQGVLQEVERQKQTSRNGNGQLLLDAEELRRVSESLSESARQLAIRTGDMDQLAVLGHLPLQRHLVVVCPDGSENDRPNQHSEGSVRRQSEPPPTLLHSTTKSKATRTSAANNSGCGAVEEKSWRRRSIFSFIPKKKNT